jgi:hypothetical protein
MKIIILYITSILFICQVIFPLIAYPKKKDDQIIFNQSPIFDIFEILNISILFVFIIYRYIGYEWYNWITFVFPLGYFLIEFLQIIQVWNSEIIIDNDFLYIRKTKYDRWWGKRNIVSPKKIQLKKNSFKFSKDWNEEEIVEIAKYRKLIRAYYVTMNEGSYNLNEYRLHVFYNQFVKALNEKVPSQNIKIEINKFEKYNGIKWIYTILFILSLTYYLK